jgi:hypothetical protein
MVLGDGVPPRAVRSQRVVLDAYAFIKGWLISTVLGVALLLFWVAASYGAPDGRDGTGAGHIWGLLGIAALFGFGVALVFAAPLAWVLAYLLRPIQDQRIHVGAFFVVPTLAFWLVGGILGLGWQPFLLIPWAVVGAVAAVGRWAIRKDVLPRVSAGRSA